MRIRRISKRFDKDQLYDAYTGDILFKGQFATFEGRQVDGTFNRRRTVSYSPDYSLPPRRCVTVYGEVWIMSEPMIDGFQGEPVRVTCSARKSNGLFQVLTAGELLNKTGTREAHVFLRYLKGTAEPGSSNLQPYYEASLSLTETNLAGKFYTDGNIILHGRMEANAAEGFSVVECDMIGGSEAWVKVKLPGVFDPVELTEVPGAEIVGLLVERYSFFTKYDQAQENNYHGDKTLIVSKSSMAVPEGSLTLQGSTLPILGVEDLGDGWALHVRKVS